MIIQLDKNIADSDKASIADKMKSLEFKATEVKTQRGTYLVGIGKKEFDLRQLGHMKGIADIHRVSDDYKLVSRKWKVGRSSVDLGDGVAIGDGELSVMAGPCSIGTGDQAKTTLHHLAR